MEKKKNGWSEARPNPFQYYLKHGHFPADFEKLVDAFFAANRENICKAMRRLQGRIQDDLSDVDDND